MTPTTATSNGQQKQELQQQQQFKLINSNHHVQTLENGSLAIRSVGLEHEGSYLCEADNGVEPNLAKSIRLLVHLQAQFADSDIQLMTTGNTNANIDTSTSSNNNSHQQHQLIQLQTSIQQAPASATSALASGQVLVRLARVLQNTTLTKLACSPSGDLPLTVDWLKDGQLVYSHTWQASAPAQSASLKHQLELGPRYQIVTRERSRSKARANINVISVESELSVSALRRQDGGLYACLARNAFGQAERNLRLLVQEPPEAPELIDIAHISSRSIGLRWLAPYDGNSPILKYSIEFRKQLNSAQGESSGQQINKLTN